MYLWREKVGICDPTVRGLNPELRVNPMRTCRWVMGEGRRGVVHQVQAAVRASNREILIEASLSLKWHWHPSNTVFRGNIRPCIRKNNSSIAAAVLSMSIPIENFSVAKIEKLLHRPLGRSVIGGQCQEKTGGKEMFWDVDGRQTEMKMLGCRMTMSSKGVVQQLEMSVDRQLLAGMVARAVGVTRLTDALSRRQLNIHIFKVTYCNFQCHDQDHRGPLWTGEVPKSEGVLLWFKSLLIMSPDTSSLHGSR